MAIIDLANINNSAAAGGGGLKDKDGQKYAYWDLSLLGEDFEFTSHTDTSHLFEGTANYDAYAEKIQNIDVSGATDFKKMYAGCDATTITTPTITESTTTFNSYESAFEGCTATTINLSADWSKNITYKSTKNMFKDCHNLETVKANAYGPNSGQSFYNFEGMFENCYKLKTVDGKLFQTFLSITSLGAVEPASARNWFKNCYNLSGIVSGQVRIDSAPSYLDPDASYAFYKVGSEATTKPQLRIGLGAIQRADYCFAGASFSLLRFVTNLYSLLYANHFCDSVVGLSEHPNITSKIKEADYAFQNCTALKTGIDWDFSDLETAKGMYKGCTSLLSCTASTIGDYDTPHLRDISEMFSGCTSLVQIPAFDCTYVQDATDVVKDCTSLQLLNQGGFKNLHCDLDLSTATAITADSLVNLLSVLGTVSGKTLTLGDTNKAKLTADQIAVATAKGWTVV